MHTGIGLNLICGMGRIFRCEYILHPNPSDCNGRSELFVEDICHTSTATLNGIEPTLRYDGYPGSTLVMEFLGRIVAVIL